MHQFYTRLVAVSVQAMSKRQQDACAYAPLYVLHTLHSFNRDIIDRNGFGLVLEFTRQLGHEHILREHPRAQDAKAQHAKQTAANLAFNAASRNKITGARVCVRVCMSSLSPFQGFL
jgi:hypothetical protein